MNLETKIRNKDYVNNLDVTILKLFTTLLLLAISLQANNKEHAYASSSECKVCHTKIYDEFYTSMHANSTPQKDPIHNAIWSKHPLKNKHNRYSCGKCHTPAADNLNDMKTKGKKALPDINNKTHQEGISCAYCHRIESISIEKRHNTNIMSDTPRNYFGTRKENLDSPYHGIVSEGNEHMQNGNVCIGCHSHNVNKSGLNLCSSNVNNEMDASNCVSCHMPHVKGSVSNLYKTDTHTFHGFAGSHSNSHMLEKYVDISILRNIDHFMVNIDNRASHALLLHPLRLAVLKVTVKRDSKTTKMKNEIFVRVIGKDGKPAMPWVADKELKNTMIQANEKRVIKYDFKIQKGDIVDVTLGWYLVNPKAVKKLNLENYDVATKFNVFKKKSFKF